MTTAQSETLPARTTVRWWESNTTFILIVAGLVSALMVSLLFYLAVKTDNLHEGMTNVRVEMAVIKTNQQVIKENQKTIQENQQKILNEFDEHKDEHRQ